MKTGKLVLAYLLLGAVGLVDPALSASARPFPPEYQAIQANGAKLTITMTESDEASQLGRTVDGYSVLFDAATGNYVYAVKNAQGDLVVSKMAASDPAARSDAEKAFVAKLAKNLAFSKAQAAAISAGKFGSKFTKSGVSPMKGSKPFNLFPRGFPSKGQNLKHLVICVDYADLAWTIDMTNMTNYYNQAGYQGPIPDQQGGSFRDWYKASSYNQLTIDTTVVGPYHLVNKRAYYSATWNPKATPNPYGPGLLVLEACAAAYAAGVDFSQFDNDHNGWVDTIGIVFAGYSAQGSDPYGQVEIMSSLHCYKQTPPIYNGGKVCAFYMIAELRRNQGKLPESISAAVHEFGHGLWLWDYPLGYWSEMHLGPYAGGWGDIPTDMDAYCKEKLGWSRPKVLNTTGTGKRLRPVSSYNEYFRIDTLSGPGEYFLLENRQQTGYDRFLPGHGLMIYHIAGETSDPLIQPYIRFERANNDPHTYPSEAAAPGVPFPGPTNVTSISDNHVEADCNLRDLNGAKAGIAITHIAENGGVITFDFIKTAPPNTEQFCTLATVDTGALKSGSHANTHASNNRCFIITAAKVGTQYTIMSRP